MLHHLRALNEMEEEWREEERKEKICYTYVSHMIMNNMCHPIKCCCFYEDIRPEDKKFVSIKMLPFKPREIHIEVCKYSLHTDS